MFNIYSPEMAFLGELEDVSSTNLVDNWDSIGTISLTAALTQHNEALLANDRIIVLSYLPGVPGAEDDIPPYIICNVQRNAQTKTLTVNGKSADYLLRYRSIIEPHFEAGPIPEAVKGLIQDNLKGIPLTVGSFPGDDRQALLPEITLESTSLSDAAFQLLQYGGYGRQLRRTENGISFLVDPGRDHRYTAEIPVLSPDNGSAIGPVVGDDGNNACNVAVARLKFGDKMPELSPDPELQQEYEDGWAEIYSIGDTEATGAERRELWCGDYIQGSDETEEEFRARATEDMQRYLRENIRILNLHARIDPADYGTLYRTGDLLRAKVGDYSFERRVTSAEWTKDRNGLVCVLRLGPPTNNVLRELKKTKPMSSAVSGGIGSALGGVAKANKKILDLHRKWLTMVIAIDDVSAGLDAAIENFDEFKRAATSVFAQVDKNKAGLDLIATEDVLADLKEAKTTLYAKVNDEFVKEAYLELYAVSDGQGGSRTFAELVADAIYLEAKTTVLGNLSVEDGRVKASRGFRTPAEVECASLDVSGSHILVGGNAFTPQGDIIMSKDGINLDGDIYIKQPITSSTGQVITVLGA